MNSRLNEHNKITEQNTSTETSKPKFEVSSTAKLAVAVKYVTAQPSFNEFTLVIDYLSQSFINNIGSPYNTMFKTGIDNIEEFANEHDLSITNKGNMHDLEIEYKVDMNPDQKNESYNLCALRK